MIFLSNTISGVAATGCIVASVMIAWEIVRWIMFEKLTTRE